MNDSLITWSLIFFLLSRLCYCRYCLTIYLSTCLSAISLEDVIVRYRSNQTSSPSSSIKWLS
jgi:hypothetical protein